MTPAAIRSGGRGLVTRRQVGSGPYRSRQDEFRARIAHALRRGILRIAGTRTGDG